MPEGRRGKGPTPEELEFIYQLLVVGYGDADIIEKYEELKKHGKLGSLPYRSDIRFIRQRRRELEAVRRVLEKDFRRKADPVLAGYRRKHLEEVENTIRRQKDKLSVSSPRYAPFPPELDQLLIYTPDQGMLPFRKLDKHLPETLWAKFKQRELKHSDYLESCSQLLKEIEDESEKRTGLRTDRSTA